MTLYLNQLSNQLRTLARSMPAGRLLQSLWERPPVSSVRFVTATRLGEADFWKCSALGRSAALWRTDAQVSFSIASQNLEGLPAVYNRALSEGLDLADVLVFLHDDVWLNDHALLDKLRLALKRFDVVGLAGNRRRLPCQPAWLFSHREGQRLIWDSPHLSGSVGHGRPGDFNVMGYGLTPAACELLDGVLLAVRSDVARACGLHFDERFRFHFYDMDFCRTARKAGLTLGTWPIDVIHESAGAFGSEEWERQFQLYLKKWRK